MILCVLADAGYIRPRVAMIATRIVSHPGLIASFFRMRASGPGVLGWVTMMTMVPTRKIKATSHSYRKNVRLYIVPGLGGVKVRDLTIGRVESFGAGLVKGGLQPTTARLVLSQLRTMLSAAVRDSLISSNPVQLARKPRGEVKKLEPYPMADLVRIIAHASTYSAVDVVALLAGCGCRAGEAMGLDVTDFDPVKCLLSITKTWDRVHGLGPPKSRHSIRTIRVPASVVPILQGAVGNRKTGPLFASGVGNRRIHTSVREAWRLTCRDLGLEFRKVHQLRHSVATALISEGVPLGDVAKFLGDTVETVVKTYLHPAGTDPSDTLDRLHSLQGGGKVGKAVG